MLGIGTIQIEKIETEGNEVREHDAIDTRRWRKCSFEKVMRATWDCVG